MVFFKNEAKVIGRGALLIALLTAALNCALTGSGLKENLIKILKATLFFIIITAVYPRIIGWISWYSFYLAQNSVYEDVKSHFDVVTDTMEDFYFYYANFSSSSIHTDSCFAAIPLIHEQIGFISLIQRETVGHQRVMVQLPAYLTQYYQKDCIMSD